MTSTERPECETATGTIARSATSRPSTSATLQTRDRPGNGLGRGPKENPERYQRTQDAFRQSGRKRIADRKSHLKRTFGLSEADYERLLAAQGGGCAICGRLPNSRNLHIDHDHETGQVRGALCFACNVAIGHLRDDPMIAVKLLDYLERHRAS